MELLQRLVLELDYPQLPQLGQGQLGECFIEAMIQLERLRLFQQPNGQINKFLILTLSTKPPSELVSDCHEVNPLGVFDLLLLSTHRG
jgi:hypothetical protein